MFFPFDFELIYQLHTLSVICLEDKQSSYRILQLTNKSVGNDERVIITRSSITGLPPSNLLDFEFFLHASQKTTVFLSCIF